MPLSPSPIELLSWPSYCALITQQIILFISRMSSGSSISTELLPPVRRVITGHDAEGHGTVKINSLIAGEESDFPGCEGLRSGGLWTTVSVPSKDTNTDVDGAERPIGGQGLVLRNGTNLRFTDLAPGSSSPMHRTSSVDYNALITGKLILVTDDGSETLLENPGDTVVMRGNLHAWRNPGPGWARWVSVLVDAEPAVVNGKPQEDVWHA
ncbi:hypothetical protein DFH11DRAFT_37950 [Phellopilus nigrolimitatus]|nr:hypothetical protein DFH11DRAFT_37950 [Phellopilus nigrolimitatus]